MKNKLLVYSLRKIKNNRKRFISLLFMALLGVGFFVGIKATSPDMIKSLDKYLDKKNVYDIELVSNVGFTDIDIKELKEIKNINSIEGTYMKDTYVSVNDREYTIRLLSLTTDMNELYINAGRLPKKDTEVVVEKRFLVDNKLKIGDTITIEDINIEENEFKIVGEVISPLYFSRDRGNTNIGNGQIKYYFYTTKETIKTPYYTHIYLTIKNLKKETTNSTEYKEKLAPVKKKITTKKKELETRRFNELYQSQIIMATNLGQTVDTSSLIKPKITVNERSDNSSYKDVIDASTNIEKIGNVFPLVFYIIAILISLITMMRMVDEDRSENGTMKALGYNTFDVLIKYLLFSFIATITGSLIGIVIGCNLIPSIIWDIYKLMFTVPYFVCEINMQYAVIGTLIALVCIVCSAVITCIQNLKSVPAELMRPKAPKSGKRVLIEKISFLWKRLKFSQKITVRNIFRYKSRVLTTIFGITGCTALILAGFGLRDAIKDIVTYQYDHVFHYDRMLALDTTKDTTNLLEDWNKKKEIVSVNPCLMKDTTMKYKGDSTSVTLISSSDFKKLDKVISLYDIDKEKKKIYPEKDGAIISEKTRNMYNLKIGDKITIYDEDDKPHKVKVTNITENYVNQYIYLSKESYEKIFKDYQENTVLLKLKDDLSKEKTTALDKELLENEEVTALLDVYEMMDLVKRTMKSLDSVVLVLIIAAALLAFIVLYNLSNINISERKREIATLKVLGFYNKEVDDYITKENMILTTIGIIFGLILGKQLSNFIIATCEPDSVMFVRDITLFSYIISACITILFTIIVNWITHFSLKKINMIESLKNVE